MFNLREEGITKDITKDAQASTRPSRRSDLPCSQPCRIGSAGQRGCSLWLGRT